MQNIYVTASDIDFSRYIGSAFTYLVMNPDFHTATAEGQKTAICTAANALAQTRAILCGWEYSDHMNYLMKIVKVSTIKPKDEDDPDVYYTYHAATNQVY